MTSTLSTLIARLPQSECVHGGSHGGVVYQNYPWPPLDHIPAKRNTTQERLDFIHGLCEGWEGKRVLDVGCSNGALSIGMSMWGAEVVGWDRSLEEVEVAREAGRVLGSTARFEQQDITSATDSRVWDVAVYLSVWKWVAWRGSVEAANRTIDYLRRHTRKLIFESGITGTGIDLVSVGLDEVEGMLYEHFEKVRDVGVLPRDAQQVDRKVWVCE